MSSLVLETLGWAWAYVQHVVIMFYWVWIPGLLVVGLIGSRYRPPLEGIVVEQQQGARAFLAAIGWGMTSGAGRRTSLDTAKTLWAQGVPDDIVLAFLVASQNLGLYSLVLLTILIGIEFSLGVVLGGLVMIGVLRLGAPARVPGMDRPPDRQRGIMRPAPERWAGLLGSARGWSHAVRDAGRYLRHVGLSLVGGLLLGALVLAVDTAGYWFFPEWMGDETAGAALVGAFLASLLSVPLFLAPGGNLIVVASIWKTWTLAYAGVISFVLMSTLNPLTAYTLMRRYSGARGWALLLALYVSAALGGLLVEGVFALLGVQVTHVPWFRELVDRLIMIFPGTMLGAPGGMKGM